MKSNYGNGRMALLYVEDDPDTRELIGRALADEYPDFELHVAAGGAEGLELFREHRPQLVLTDIRMPVIDGLRMAGEIKTIDPGVNLIALTAYSDTSYLLSAIEVGFSHYVLKPIDFDKLFAAIEKSLQVLALKRQVSEQNEQIRQFAADLEKRVEERTRELQASRNEVETQNLKLRELTSELKGARDRYWNLYNWSPLGYLSLDEQLTIREINITGAKILGSRRAELLGASIEQYLPPESMALLLESFHQCVQEKHAVTELRIAIQTTHLYVQLHCIPYKPPCSNVKLFRTAIIDITKLKEAEEALLRETVEKLDALQELRKRDQLLIQQSHFAAMGELMSTISHHWRQPLNSLGLIVQGLSLRCKRGDFTQDFVDDSTVEAIRMIGDLSRTINNFGYYFKSGDQKITFNAKEVVERAISLVEGRLREHRLNLEVIIEGEAIIEGVQREFFQVLLNILMNAVDISLERKVEEPKIVVRILIEDGKSVITIADNAGGIPEEIIGRIFEPYFTTKETSHGSGVGLYMAKIIIERNMHGLLSVRNTGDGAEFRIEI